MASAHSARRECRPLSHSGAGLVCAPAVASQRCIEESLQRGLSDPNDDDLLSSLCDLFHTISSQKKRYGVHAPRRFVAKLRAENEVFNNMLHQDAHELLNYLLNEMAEILEKRQRRHADESAEARHQREAPAERAGGVGHSGDAEEGDEAAMASGDEGAAEPAPAGDGAAAAASPKTWIHALFEGLLTNETRCLCCDSVTNRDESFLDLSLEIEQDSSVSACMRNFSASESLRADNKFFCDTCMSLQEARKRMRVKRLPRVLALHLKRFKYVEQLQRFKKLSYRVAFPLELTISKSGDMQAPPEEPTHDDGEDGGGGDGGGGDDEATGDRKYSLFAVIVHAGSGPNQCVRRAPSATRSSHVVAKPIARRRPPLASSPLTLARVSRPRTVTVPKRARAPCAHVAIALAALSPVLSHPPPPRSVRALAAATTWCSCARTSTGCALTTMRSPWLRSRSCRPTSAPRATRRPAPRPPTSSSTRRRARRARRGRGTRRVPGARAPSRREARAPRWRQACGGASRRGAWRAAAAASVAREAHAVAAGGVGAAQGLRCAPSRSHRAPCCPGGGARSMGCATSSRATTPYSGPHGRSCGPRAVSVVLELACLHGGWRRVVSPWSLGRTRLFAGLLSIPGRGADARTGARHCPGAHRGRERHVRPIWTHRIGHGRGIR